MNLGVIHWGFPPRGGGVETHLITVLPEVARLGVNVCVLTETMEGQKEEEDVYGIKLFRKEDLLTTKLDERLKNGENLYASSKKLFDEFIKKNKISTIHAHNLHMDYFDLSKALIDSCAENKINCYLIMHNHEFIDRHEETMRKIIKDLPWTKLVPISMFIEKALQKKIPGIPREEWQVVLHGIDLEEFRPLTKIGREDLKKKYGFSGKRVILHPARIMKWKGIIPAIKAMPAIVKKFPDAHLVLTGRIKPIFKAHDEISEYNELVDRTIEELGLKDNVHVGKYTLFDIPKLNALSDIVIYTTIGDEPFGLCPVEAMASGVPAIVTASGGLVESVVDGETGFIIKKDEAKIPAELSERIIRLFSDQNLMEEMGKNGRIRAKKLFGKRRMAKELVSLLN